MGRVLKSRIEMRLKFYSKLLFEFSCILTPHAFLLIIIYFGEYLLAKYSNPVSNLENETGARTVLQVSNAPFYRDIVNLRNAITHYDNECISNYLSKISRIDYADYLPDDFDDVIMHCMDLLATVDYHEVRKYLLMEA